MNICTLQKLKNLKNLAEKYKIVNKVTEVTKALPPRFPRSQYDFKEELEKVAEYGDVPKDIFRELLKF